MKAAFRLKDYVDFKGMRRRGQILIPSMLVIPSLLIFVYLLFETTKISREKIRQQFAIDSAVFIQMGDYTNLLNRTAYVNGAFPYRIFKEAYGCDDTSNMHEPIASTGQSKCMYEILYETGAIPHNQQDSSMTDSVAKPISDGPWDIRYSPNIYNGGYNRALSGNDLIHTDDSNAFFLIDEQHATKQFIGWQTVSEGIYQFYAQVYSLLGSVEAAQWTVFKRITEDATFLRKSYYLNAGTQDCIQSPKSCAQQAVGYFQRGSKISNIYRRLIVKLGFYAQYPTPGGTSPYYLGKTDPPMEMKMDKDTNGLFRTAGFAQNEMGKLGNGVDVYQGWTAPANYFNVDFNRVAACREVGKPCVHSKIASQCPKSVWSKGEGENNCVWPMPTPKYQTRLYP
jgi:hypothetical protein